MKPEEIFKVIDKQGWNCLGEEFEVLNFFDDCIMNKHYTTIHSMLEIFYDKTPKNVCQCIAEIKVKQEIDSERSFLKTVKASPQYLLFREKEIRHKLLCELGDNWVEKINNFLGGGLVNIRAINKIIRKVNEEIFKKNRDEKK